MTNPIEKSMRTTMLAISFGLFALISFGLNLPYHLVYRDVVLGATLLPDLLYSLLILAETAVYAVGFSLIVASLFLRLSGTTARLTIIHAVAAVLRRVCDLALTLILFGSISVEDLLYGLLYLLVDGVFVTLVLLLAKGRASRFYRRLSLDNRAATVARKEKPVAPLSRLYPFEKFVSKKNPVTYCALILTVVLVAARFVSRILYDIDYGAPEDFSELLTMVVYYAADLFVGAFYYVLSILTLKRVLRAASEHETKKESESV